MSNITPWLLCILSAVRMRTTARKKKEVNVNTTASAQLQFTECDSVYWQQLILLKIYNEIVKSESKESKKNKSLHRMLLHTTAMIKRN